MGNKNYLIYLSYLFKCSQIDLMHITMLDLLHTKAIIRDNKNLKFLKKMMMIVGKYLIF